MKLMKLRLPIIFSLAFAGAVSAYMVNPITFLITGICLGVVLLLEVTKK